MLEKLEITAYIDEKFKRKAPRAPLKVPINPSTYSHSLNIDYDEKKAAGSAGGSPVFNKMGRETINFDLVFDGTGAVPMPPDVIQIKSKGIADQIQALKEVTCSYNGEIHSPYFLKLVWGLLLFKCRLSSLDLTYSLFTPNGIPLRATAHAGFICFTDEYELQARARKSSPDLTKLVTVQAGDSLPLLCHRIYGHSRYYSQVAEANGLTGFRGLRPGMQLVFPPLSGSA